MAAADTFKSSLLPRKADAGVAQAVAQIERQIRSKRMMLFGLRGLAELCVPSNSKSLENSEAALNLRILPLLQTAVQSYGDDEDVIGAACKIIDGIAARLSSDDAEAAVSTFEAESGFQVAGTTLTRAAVTSSDEDFEVALGSALALLKLRNEKPSYISADVVGAVLQRLARISSLSTFIKGTQFLKVFSEGGPEAMSELKANGAGERIITSVTQHFLVPKSGGDTAAAAAEALDFLRLLARDGHLGTQHIEGVVRILEAYKSNKLVADRGSAVLVYMLGPESLNECLRALTSRDPHRYSEALVLLASMSYIGSYADAVVDAGGIPLLCDALSLSNTAANDQTAARGITGAAKMLGRIADKPQYIEAVKQAGAVEALSSATKNVSSTNTARETLAALIAALSPLVADSETAAAKARDDGMLHLALNTLREGKTEELQTSAMSLLTAFLKHTSFLPEAITLRAPENVAGILMHAKKETASREAAVGALARLIPHLNSIEPYEAAHSSLMNVLEDSANPNTVKLCYDILFSLATHLPDAAVPFLQKQEPLTVNIVLQTMLRFHENAVLMSSAAVILDKLASERDVRDCLTSLAALLDQARARPKPALAALAGVNGLSQVVRLRPVFEEQDAVTSLLRGLQTWMSTSTAFPEQDKLIQATARSIEEISAGQKTPKIVTALLEISVLPAVRNIIERQEGKANSLLDILNCARRVARNGWNLEPSQVPGVIEAIKRVLTRYQDVRSVQIVNLQMLVSLLQSSNPSQVRQAVLAELNNSGVLKMVVSHMIRVAMFDDVQLIGFQFLKAILVGDSSDIMADKLRNVGTLELCKVVRKAHANNNAVQAAVTPVLNALAPTADSLQDSMKAAVDTLSEALYSKERIPEPLNILSTLTVTSAGAKAAVNARLGVDLQRCTDVLPTLDESQQMASLWEISQILGQLANHRVSVLHLNRCGGTQMVASLVEQLESLPASGVRDKAVSNLLNTGRLLMRADARSADITTTRRLLALFNKMQTPGQKNLGAACKCVASFPEGTLRTTPELIDFIDRLIANSTQQTDVTLRSEALTALHQLIDDARPEMVDYLFQNKELDKLLAQPFLGENNKIMFPDETMACLASLASVARGRPLWSPSSDLDRQALFRNYADMLQSKVTDPLAIQRTLIVLNSSLRSTDASLLQQFAMQRICENILAVHPSNKAVTEQVGRLLAYCGGPEELNKLFKQIIELGKHITPQTPLEMQRILDLVAVLIPAAGPADPSNAALRHSAAACDAMASVLKQQSQNDRFATSVALVARRLADACEKSDAPMAASNNRILGGLTRSLCPVMADFLATEHANSGGPLSSSPNFLGNAFAALAIGVQCDSTFAAKILSQKGSKSVVAAAFHLLQIHSGQPEVQAQIHAFLAAVANLSGGLELLTTFPGRNISTDLSAEMAAVLRRNYASGRNDLCAPTVELLGTLMTNVPGDEATRQMLELLALLGDDIDLEIMIALLKALTSQVRAGRVDIASEDGFARAAQRLQLSLDNSVEPLDKRRSAIAAFSELVEALAQGQNVAELRAMHAADVLTELLEQYPNDARIVRSLMRALRALAEIDHDAAAKLSARCVGVLASSALPHIRGDNTAAIQTLRFLYALSCNEGNGRIMQGIPNFSELLEAIKAAVAGASPEEQQELQIELDAVLNSVESESRKALTLKEVYESWVQRLGAGEALEIGESEILLQQFEFVCDYVADYGRNSIKSAESELGSELIYGCRCFVLLHEYPGNTAFGIDKDEHRFFLTALRKQADIAHVQQSVVAALVGLTKHFDGATAFASINSQATVTNAMRQGLEVSVGDAIDADGIMIPRIQLLAQSAIKRQHYDGTDAFLILLSVWDACDEKRYTIATLCEVFRAMRKIVGEAWVPLILERNVVQRLLEIVESEEILALMPDVLFLLGVLSTVSTIKTLIGNSNGVEIILARLRKCVAALRPSGKNSSRRAVLGLPLSAAAKIESSPNIDGDNGSTSSDPPIAATLTNGCLALANLIIGHPANSARFVADKGVELNVEICRIVAARSEERRYDIGNAGSVLVCNACFHRDDLKRVYGSRGGAKAVADIINSYDGSNSKTAFRCLASMLKAIGNLALYTPNVNEFLDNRIEETFSHFYEKSSYLPADLVQVSLRTFSNLVIEYTDDIMGRFGVMVVPILRMLQNRTMESDKTLALAFEALSNLCRYPKNSRAFLDAGGAEFALQVANSHSNPEITVAAIQLLRVQLNDTGAIPELLEVGTLDFLVRAIDNESSTMDKHTELLMSALRCLRLLLNTRESAESFLNANGAHALIRALNGTTDHGAIPGDIFKIFLLLFNTFRGPAALPPAVDAGAEGEWSAVPSDEGRAPRIYSLERPPSPRAWETLKFRPADIRKIILEVSAALSRDVNVRQLKSQRWGLGILAYFACEKVPGTMEAFEEAQWTLLVSQAFDNFAGDINMLEICSHIIPNVLYGSEFSAVRTFCRDRALLSSLQKVTKTIPRKQAAVKDTLVGVQKLLERKEVDPNVYGAFSSWEFPLEITGWDADPYPRGVHDLPTEIKDELRNGGQATVVAEGHGTKVPVTWSSSQDLLTLYIRGADFLRMPNIAITHIRSMHRSIHGSQTLSPGAPERKQAGSNVLVLVGLPSEEAPTGEEIILKFRSQKAREALFKLILLWRDAAASM